MGGIIIPTNTFFNLTEEKQKKILDAAKNEFITYSYYDASINRIIKESDISRGSFYMYFENKEDLFIFLMQKNMDTLLENLTTNIPKDMCDVFTLNLLIYDFVTSDKIDSDCRKLLKIILTKLDINLINHCVNLQDDKIKIDLIKKYTNISKLNISCEKELVDIADIIFSAVLIEIMFVFSGRNTVLNGRENIERKFKLIKQGVLL
ncbi:MAG: TetR/AcrR family transcriptional regulator [Clostridium sp.]|nr:TetR/AcrR family transcriptional regulator [Clostridium sp.]